MKIELTPKETALLESGGIAFSANHDYTEDEALDLLERVRELEVLCSQGTDKETEQRYQAYSSLGDKLFEMTP